MKLIADLHIHSKYSRAVSQQMVIPEIAKWAEKKGIDLVGTGDWTHPLWLRELKANLEEGGNGIYRLKSQISNLKSQNQNLNLKSEKSNETLFLLTAEISSIYSQGGKSRRIHNLIFSPSFETVDKINNELIKRGCNLMSDGRPIIGLSSRDLVNLVLSVDKDCLVIPAHCLPPSELIHTEKGIKKINEIKKDDKVYTHKNRLKTVTKIFVRSFKGKIYKIIPDYFRLGLTLTGEHPIFAIKTKGCASFKICRPTCSALKKCCARRYFKKYQPEWVKAQALKDGDVIVYPRFTLTEDKKYILLSDYLDKFKKEGKELVSSGGNRRHKITNLLKIDKDFCYLIGLFLAEGYTSRDLVSFSFHENERALIEKVKMIIEKLFGIKKFKEYKRKNYQAIELTIYSKVLHQFFSKFCYQNPERRRANNKCLPYWMLKLPVKLQKDIFVGWWEGDSGYTTSRLLMNQMKIICLRLGMIPSIGEDTKEAHEKRGKHDKFEERKITAHYDTYHFSNLSFFEDKFNLLNSSIFKKFKTKLSRKRGWMDNEYIYLSIRKIEVRDYRGNVYNLEVEWDNSYTTEFGCVHNCWTPWFALYGSMSGFNSIDECFGNMSQYIYGIETGLSSSPEMNWRIKELDKRAILSFSDAHSGQKLGREATVFELKDVKKLRYEDIKGAIINNEIAYTIEFYPEEGKYHFTGHRDCHVRQSPEETKKLGTTCPVCGKPLTIGVMHRVQQLATKEPRTKNLELRTGVKLISYEGTNRPPYVMLVPLIEIIAEAENSLVGSQKVISIYENLVNNFSSEFIILLETPILEIEKIAGQKVSEGIKKVRGGDIVVEPGYDGEFGVVKIWSESTKTETSVDKQKQMSLF